MPLTSRLRGFTLIETMIALILLGLTVAVVSRVITGQHRLAAVASERAALQTNLRTAMSLLRRELAELGGGSAGSDLLAIGSDSVTYRAIRGVGVACAVTASEVRVRRVPWSSFRQPQPLRDSLLFFLAADSSAGRPARWLPLPISSVTSASCSGVPAFVLGTAFDSTVSHPDSIPLDAPIRTFEVMQLRLYRVAPAWWLGARSVSGGETIQPALGPLEPAGLRLTYFDSAGHPTSHPDSVRAIQVAVKGLSTRAVRSNADAIAAVLHDSASAWLPLRNLEH